MGLMDAAPLFFRSMPPWLTADGSASDNLRDNGQRDNRMKYLIIVLLLAPVLEVTALMLACPAGILEKSFEEETRRLSGELYEEELMKLAGFAGFMERKVLRESGAAPLLRRIFVPDEEERKRSGALADMGAGMFLEVSKRFSLMSALFYRYMLRLGVFVLRAEAFVPVMLAALVSGFLRRRIRRSAFGITSAVRQRFAVRGLVATLWLSLLYDLSPCLFTPAVAAFEVICACFFVGSTVANLEKRI